ncbi:LysM domain-containing protein [Rubrivirga sp.]|uniref:LysM domain-containing protein n=1 Tax=Rubrivirga sp. TaxID=1885344 RepID=UPI003B524279
MTNTGRYADLAVATLVVTDGAGTREVRYVRRRFLPPPATEAETLAEHTVVAGDRLDVVTARYLGDPLQFWRVADANLVIHPTELTDEVGERIRIALPQM